MLSYLLAQFVEEGGDVVVGVEVEEVEEFNGAHGETAVFDPHSQMFQHTGSLCEYSLIN